MRYEVPILGILMLALVSCGGSGNGDPEPEPPVLVTPPSAATLIFPDNNTECNEGVVVNATQSTVTFRWTEAQNADTYELNVRNLDNNNTARSNVSTNSTDLTLLRGVPYEWFVISRANGTNETATSATWRFYNQGAGVENYAPFPAEVVSPERGSTVAATGNVSLVWAGSDVDNDLVDFEVFFGTDTAALASQGTTTESTFVATIDAGTIYYWRVLSRDSQSNTSLSEVFEFRVQ
ncbi:hypothetical protein SAMN06265375_1054 [Muriicola jejuensis]|uniref:Fibronectin type-III domain-containing protein n=1 Tax=Muriicola jejuensis TaxID=504488 RepID=A0A6P0UN71_9FLAO|nr:hypothetical protein [Muriicola jejuensis]NER11746.1 hypothetical protein [Muriicola jejuensis]SMP24788.1 hypothetical protein SAMN06265375_1054 [Muriicola jejuensis]